MTAIQICALIVLIVFAGLLVWAGYFELRASLDFIKADHTRLSQHCKRLQIALTLGNPERQTLREITEKLRIAADTFAAFRTGKKLERETRALIDQALAMADLLKPAELTGLAKVEVVPLRIALSTDDAESAAVFFQQEHQAIATAAQSRGAA